MGATDFEWLLPEDPKIVPPGPSEAHPTLMKLRKARKPVFALGNN